MNADCPPEASPTVLDMLRASPVGPVLDMPVPAVPALAHPAVDIPLPALPDFHAPVFTVEPTPVSLTELLDSIPVPALPELDELLRPIADLGAMFGTGICEALDPSVILQQSSRLLDGATALARTALDALPDSWQGTAAEAAADHTQQARVAAIELSERGDLIGQVTRQATLAVERGNVELTGIAQSFIGSAVAMAPAVPTPAGQAALIASAAEHLSAALAVVTRTRSELGVHTVAMHALTPPIPVPLPAATSTPVDPRTVTELMSSAAGSIGGPGSTLWGAQIPANDTSSLTVPTSASPMSAPASTVPTSYAGSPSVVPTTGTPHLGPGGSTGPAWGGTSAGLGHAATGTSAAPFSAGAAPMSTGAAGGASPAAATTAATRGPALGATPMSSAGRPENDETRRGAPAFLVSVGTPNDMVGELPLATPAVIGAPDAL